MVDVNTSGTQRDSASGGDMRILAIIAYGLFLVGWPTLHLSTLAAVILAYVQRSDAQGTIWESHFTNVINTFWVSIIAGAVVVPLCFVVVGIPLLVGLVIWFLYRTIKGLVRAIENRPFD